MIHCSQHYGVRPILRDINLQIKTGELVALMGPNGMGKSTLMAVMAGLIPPARGFVRIDGMRRRESKEIETDIRRKVVYLPADPFLPAFTTTREWLMGVGRLYGHDDEQLMSHIRQLIELFDLKVIADSSTRSASSGQRKKIALCAALITEAPIMLLDEPFAGGLDPSGILALKRILARLRDTRRYTIVMATPVPELVEELADRIAILRGGELVAFDTLAALQAQFNGGDGRLDALYDRMLGSSKTGQIESYFGERGI